MNRRFRIGADDLHDGRVEGGGLRGDVGREALASFVFGRWRLVWFPELVALGILLMVWPKHGALLQSLLVLLMYRKPLRVSFASISTAVRNNGSCHGEMTLFTNIFLHRSRSRNMVRFGADRISLVIDPYNDLSGRLGPRCAIKRTKTTRGTY